MEEPEPCPFEVWPGRRHVDPEPPEICGEPVEPGEEFCLRHLDE